MNDFLQMADDKLLKDLLQFYAGRYQAKVVVVINNAIEYSADSSNGQPARMCHYTWDNGEVVGEVKAWGSSLRNFNIFARHVMLHVEVAYLRQKMHEVQQRLIEEIKAHTELEEALKFMELRALQSQINPHFLFNTLSTLAGLAMFEGAQETETLITSLSRLLRYSLRKIGQTVTISEEIKHVQDYCSIQKARFGDRIDINYRIADEILPVQIPVLTLQPIVENAIIHGLEAVERGCLLIQGERSGDDILLRVADNGVGIEPQKLAEIKSLSVNSSGRSHTTGLGLTNVHRRLQHFYGRNYGLQVDSIPGKGTTVVIRIPYAL